MLSSEVQGKNVRVFDVLHRVLIWELGHESDIGSVKFSENGMRLVTTCKDGSIHIWDMKTGSLQRKIDGESEEIVFTWFKE